MDISVVLVPLMVVLAVAVAISLVFSNWWLTSLAGVVLAVVLGFTYGGEMVSFSIEHWDQILGGMVVYMFLGAMWSFFRYFRYTHNQEAVSSLRKALKEWSTRDPGVPFKDSAYYPYELRVPKSTTISWIVFWPFSMAMYFFFDMLKEVAEFLYEKLLSVYSGITDHAIRKAEEDE